MAWLAALVFVGGSAVLGYLSFERNAVDDLQTNVSHRLELFSSAVEGMIQRLEHVPATVQLSEEVQRLFHGPRNAALRQQADRYLQRLNAFMGGIAIYVLDERGAIVASSSSARLDAVPETDFSFRPYFLEALSGRVGRHFAISLIGRRPAYFVSHPIRDGAKVVGVAVIMINLDPINQIWDMLGGPALLADTNGVVILSSDPDWIYTTLQDLPIERRVDLQLNRMYDQMPLQRFPLPVRLKVNPDTLAIQGDMVRANRYLGFTEVEQIVSGRSINGMDWRVMLFTDVAEAQKGALVAGGVSAVGAAFVVLLVLFAAQRRRIGRHRRESERLLEQANLSLEHKVGERTAALTAANAQLKREVAERKQTEATLRSTQDELVHSAKMAVLGRIAAGIAHELTQPLGGVRTFAGNAMEFAKRQDLESVQQNLSIIARLTERMGTIIHPLRSFARRTEPSLSFVDVGQSIADALFLYQTQLAHLGVTVDNRTLGQDLPAWCDAHRLEQVLVNLIGNAIDAMADAPVKQLTLAAERAPALQEAAAADGRAYGLRLDIEDTGCGLPPDFSSHLFEPFYTTKQKGLGLGLTISRDIVQDFGGAIRAWNRHGPGACFSIYLPCAPQ
jgi:two-component system C4-dicarboxylate transport sensor histidine kinase DctB